MSELLRYCPDLFSYQRRESREVMIGNVGMGGRNPIRVQSMITSDTRDVEASVGQVLGLAEAGCEIVRITAQTRKYAEFLKPIAEQVRAAGVEVPLVADIHFKPDAALEAAKWVEKVRVNPGNYADKKKFEIREYTDEQYGEELERIREQFVPLVELSKEKNRAMRIGTNHGSLSDRIMNRYGDTPLGMVESALEFARIARDLDYHNFVFSMKASNPKVMIEAYRLLVARLYAEGGDWNYPLHLGVTEAGDGEDGRIKSAIGIGSLLADGIGDTIRVSLTEDAVEEIPVAKALVKSVAEASVADPSLGQSVPDASSGKEIERKRHTYLPHWTREGATYAVTFRLADSLPKAVLDDYRNQRQLHEDRLAQIKKDKGSSDAEEELTRLHKDFSELYSKTVESSLHQGVGECLLAKDGCGEIVESALKFFDGERYQLYAWVVMSNHVHAILRPFAGQELSGILHSWKSFTATQLNQHLGRTGTLWQKESYDHLIRDGEDFRNQVRYVLENPSGLSDGFRVDSVWGKDWATAAGSISNGLPQGCGSHRGLEPAWDPFSFERRASSVVACGEIPVGGRELMRVFVSREKYAAVEHKLAGLGDFQPEVVTEEANVLEVDPRNDEEMAAANSLEEARVITVRDGVEMEVIAAFRLLATRLQKPHPILLKDVLTPSGDAQKNFLDTLLMASKNLGSLICDGIGDAILVQGEVAPGQSLRLSYNILQAAGARIFKTDYVACPSCGRTLFDLQETTQNIRAATGHLKGVRIAVMGCIVNGPGEMADADFGYVGGAPGKINLYVGKQAVKFNIPEVEAVDCLVDLIKEHDRWVDAPEKVVVEG